MSYVKMDSIGPYFTVWGVKMNEKEALELKSTWHLRYAEYEEMRPKDFEAKIYLEAIEKAKGLEGALDKVLAFFVEHADDDGYKFIQEALAKWEKEK